MFMSKKTVALGAIAALAAGAAAPAIAQQQINGSGASFPAPMFATWFDSLR
ncbi:MAG TPA: phosphate ABC transporter substrate-binding protein PstS, partial [Synechococcales bacterium UBA8647]|nr:phosphate ABC transporter substrate-binding protein PstS [Synechococcales bacterium UBA8647]